MDAHMAKTIKQQVLEMLEEAVTTGSDYTPDFLDEITPAQAKRAIKSLRRDGHDIGELTSYWLNKPDQE